MHILLLALCCSLFAASPAAASTGSVAPPVLQSWSDTGLIAADDDWSRVPGVMGYRGDGLVSEPGVDPRTVVADGSGTPVDVTANRTDPRAVGLASGVAEFELADPVVAIQGSATASAPHLVMSLDTRGRADVSVRLVLRDVDASGADAVEPVAIQYRVGASGSFAAAPGGYVADATSGPGAATLATPVRTTLPALADGQPLVQIRVITTNAAGQDEWVGVDDVEVTAAGSAGGGACNPPPEPGPAPSPAPSLRPAPNPRPGSGRPDRAPAELTDLELRPETLVPLKRGAAIVRRGGAALRFRLSRAAVVRFEVIRARAAPGDLVPEAHSAGRRDAELSRGRFSVRGRRGLNRLRFSGRVGGRALAHGSHVLRATAVARDGGESPPSTVRFRIARLED